VIKVGRVWGGTLDGLRQERKDELAEALWGWTPDMTTEERPGPFANQRLDGLEVFWLASNVVAGRDGDPADGAQQLTEAGRDFIVLRDLHLEGADLQGAQLAGANLRLAHLERADLREAHLEQADLILTQLAGADLHEAHLEQASLDRACLEGANLFYAHLEGADLRLASLDKTTRLNEAVLTGVLLDQVTLDNPNLTVVEWDDVPVLGDELEADRKHDGEGKRKTRDTRAEEYAAAARAYRLLMGALQGKGLGDVAARYASRAQIMQRKRRFYERRWGAYFGSGFLALLAGYGYRLWRILVAYVLEVALFERVL
jgi:hypothetical protein